jgi:hypothetical protein
MRGRSRMVNVVLLLFRVFAIFSEAARWLCGAAALQLYSEVLKPGMSRKEVEDYLNAKGIAHVAMCCVEERSADADLVKIGTEKHPWYFSEHNVDIAFQFVGDRHDGQRSYHRDSDNLKVITIHHWLEGCL